jgi:hypothetical protein
LNKRKAHSILSWLLLLFFAAGQVVVFAHQHHSKYKTLIVDAHHPADQHQIVQEKCTFCDQMHHAPIYLVDIADFSQLVIPAVRLYIAAQHHYKANSLVHADGLSPPVLV